MSQAVVVPLRTGPEPVFQDRGGDEWVTRKVGIHVIEEFLQIRDGSEMLNTLLRTDKGEGGAGEESVHNVGEKVLKLNRVGVKHQRVRIRKTSTARGQVYQVFSL